MRFEIYELYIYREKFRLYIWNRVVMLEVPNADTTAD